MLSSMVGKYVSSPILRRLAADCFQIKNAVAAAHALATKQGAPLAYSHLQQAIKTSENFIREARSAGPTRIIAPRAVRRQPHQQIVQQYLSAELHCEPSEPIGPRALAGVAAEPDEHIGEVHEPTTRIAPSRTERERKSTIDVEHKTI